MGQLGKIFRLWAADHAALRAPKEKRSKRKRNAPPTHAPSLSDRVGDASDRSHTHAKQLGGVRPWATDPDAAERLWGMSEGWTGVGFGV